MDKLDRMFQLRKEGKTCKDCGRAMQFEHGEAIVCGTWHTSFSPESLCDEFQTPEEVKAANRKAGLELRKRKPHLFKSLKSFTNGVDQEREKEIER